MSIRELCVRQVIAAPRKTSVLGAAMLMRRYHVGDIVVTEETASGKCLPVGIVTDRDVVLEVIAQELDAANLSVGDIMSADLVTVREDEGVFSTIQLMRAKGVRRAPVVDDDGALVGIVSVDDLVALLAEELSELAKVIPREQKREVELRR